MELEVFESLVSYFLYRLCAFLGLIDYEFDSSRHRFGHINKLRGKILKHILFFVKLLIDIFVLTEAALHASLWWTYILLHILHSVYMYREFRAQRRLHVNFLNNLNRCLRRTRKLTNKAILLPCSVYMSLLWRIAIIVVYIDAALTRKIFNGGMLLFCVSIFYTIAPIYVRTWSVLVQLWYILEMFTVLNNHLDCVLEQLEIWGNVPVRDYQDSLKFRTVLKETISIYTRNLKLMKVYNKLHACDVILTALAAMLHLVMLKQVDAKMLMHIEVLYTANGVFAFAFIGYALDVSLMVAWYRKIHSKLAVCRAIAGMNWLPRDYERDTQIAEFIQYISIREADLSLHSRMVRRVFYGCLVITVVYYAASKSVTAKNKSDPETI